MLPVKDHNKMLTKQFIVACHREGHPNNTLTNLDVPPRLIRRNALSLKAEVEPFLTNEISPDQYRDALKEIHRNTVTNTIANYRENLVLGGYPPPVANEEKQLPRSTRTTLAQLRSGWCHHLNHYMTRLDPQVVDACPSCGGQPHDTNNLFSCPAKPTTLTPIDLWKSPVEVARFLDLELTE